MTLEDALILLLAAAAFIALFLGLAQALEGRPPRTSVRRASRPPSPGPASAARQAMVDPAAARGHPPAAAEPVIAPPQIPDPTSPPADDASIAPAGAVAPLTPLPSPGELDEPLPPAAAVVDDAVIASPPPTAAPPPQASADAPAELHAQAATALVHHRDFAGAYRHVEHAAALGELSAEQAQLLLELVAGALRRDVERLTAPAIRGGKDEARAVAGLAEAEALLGSIPEGQLALPHRAALSRRIWRAHTKLGFRRLGAGQVDGAAESLFRALAMKGVGRQRQVRDALVRTLEAMGDDRGPTVAALLGRADRAGAARVVADVEACIRRARAEGVPAEELEVAEAKLQQLGVLLERETAGR